MYRKIHATSASFLLHIYLSPISTKKLAEIQFIKPGSSKKIHLLNDTFD